MVVKVSAIAFAAIFSMLFAMASDLPVAETLFGVFDFDPRVEWVQNDSSFTRPTILKKDTGPAAQLSYIPYGETYVVEED